MADGKLDGSTTLVEAGKLSIVKAAVRSREHFPFAVSGMNENSGPIYLCRIFPPSLQHALLNDTAMSVASQRSRVIRVCCSSY